MARNKIHIHGSLEHKIFWVIYGKQYKLVWTNKADWYIRDCSIRVVDTWCSTVLLKYLQLMTLYIVFTDSLN